MNTGFVSESNESGDGKHRSWQVLVVTDNLIDRKLASGLLHKHGHQVCCADTGQQAIESCNHGGLDLVVVDLLTRNLNTHELVRTIRGRHQALGKPCAILAVAADEHDIETQCDELGLDGYVVKPLKIEEVNRWMERCARRQQQLNACRGEAAVCSIDWADALDAVDGKRELLRELVEIFFQEYPPTMEAIRDAIDKQNIKQLQLSAHKLKGCLRYFGRNAACEKAQELEHLARSGTLSGAAGRFVELETAMSTLLPMLKSPPV